MEVQNTDVTPGPPASRRRPWLAALLTLLAVPLGYAYSGRAGRGFALLAVSYLVAIAAIAVMGGFGAGGLVLGSLLASSMWLFLIVDAYRVAKRAADPFVPRRYNRWWVYLGLLVATLTASNSLGWILRATVVQAFQIPVSSMSPTLVIGDHILVDKWRAHGTPPARGDVVVFPYPEDPTKLFVKRVVGLPGETIEIRDKRVLIDGHPLDEPHAQFADSRTMRPRRDNLELQTIPPGEYFVMGDNRDQSYDSRFWGTVPGATIIGKVGTIYFSRDPQRGIAWDRLGRTVE